MKFIQILFIMFFYLFFFIRAWLLSKKLGKNIKARNNLLNVAILNAGITTFMFLLYLLVDDSRMYFKVIYSSDILSYIGTVLIAFGTIISSIASLTLKYSWRIGINESEKTDLITSGIYAISRNPYFLSYNLVLTGMMLCVLSPFLIFFAGVTVLLFHILILKEEKYLEKQHGNTYQQYRNKVRRYI